MGANIAGIYGAQIFRQDDRPRYRRAFSIACAVLAVGLALSIIRYLDDIIRRRKSAKNSQTATSDTDSLSQTERKMSAPPSDDQPAALVLDHKGSLTVSNGLRVTT